MKRPEQEDPLAYRAVRGGLWVMGTTYFEIGFGFLATIYLARTLPVAAFGTFALAIVLSHLCSVQSYLGVEIAFAQGNDTSHRAIGTFATLRMGSALASVTLVLLLSPFLRLIYSDLVVDIALILTGMAVVRAAAGVPAILLERELLFKQTSLADSLTVPISYIPAFILAATSGTVWAIVAQATVRTLLSSIAIIWIGLRRNRTLATLEWSFDADLARHYLKFGSVLGLNTIINQVRGQIMAFLGGTVLGEYQLGFLNRARQTSGWASTLFQGLLSRTGFHTFARIKDDKMRLHRAFGNVVWFLTNIAVPISVVLIIIAPDLLHLLYGPRWLPSAPLLRILAAVSILTPISAVAVRLLIALALHRMLTLNSLLSLTILVLLGIPLALNYGMLGLCCALAVTQVGVVVFLFAIVHRRAGITWRVIPLRPIAAAFAALLAYYALNRLYPMADLPLFARVPIKILLASTAYGIVVAALHGRRISEQARYVWELIRGIRSPEADG